MTLEELLDKEGFNEVCRDCKYYNEWQEYHPYGSTTASETLADCTCEDDAECPRLENIPGA